EVTVATVIDCFFFFWLPLVRFTSPCCDLFLFGSHRSFIPDRSGACG
nr:hypothetical protein [Tanacetum cinerariifolium]